MAWRRPGDKPLSEPMVVRLPTHICVTRPQWDNDLLNAIGIQTKSCLEQIIRYKITEEWHLVPLDHRKKNIWTTVILMRQIEILWLSDSKTCARFLKGRRDLLLEIYQFIIKNWCWLFSFLHYADVLSSLSSFNLVVDAWVFLRH